MQSLADLQTEILSEFPDFKIVQKTQSKLMAFVGKLLWALSFGKNKTFMQGYVTTIGHTVYTNSGWDAWDDVTKIVLLRHERIHMRQQKRMSRVLFSLYYLLFFLPIGFAYGRMKLEQEAYTESIRAELEYRGTATVWSPTYQVWLTSQFTGPAYLWTWAFPAPIARWVKATVEKCVEEHVGYKPKA